MNGDMVKDYSEYRLTRRERITFSLGITAFFAVTGWVFYASLLPALLTPFAYRRAEAVYRNYLAERRKAELLKEFRDFLYSLSSSFASGRHMAEAMEEAADNLDELYGEGGLLRRELLVMTAKMRETGETDIDLWMDFARRSHLEDIQDFTAVFGACRKTGGNLVLAVNKAASIIGEKISIEREILVMVSQKKLEGRIITALPFIIILFLQLMSPEYLHVMYTSFAGRVLMTIALFGAVAAYAAIERITRIEV